MKKHTQTKPLDELSNEELKQEVTRRRTLYHLYIAIIVTMTCTAVWNATHKGSLIFSVLPLVFMPIFFGIQKNYKAAIAELKARNL